MTVAFIIMGIFGVIAIWGIGFESGVRSESKRRAKEDETNRLYDNMDFYDCGKN